MNRIQVVVDTYETNIQVDTVEIEIVEVTEQGLRGAAGIDGAVQSIVFIASNSYVYSKLDSNNRLQIYSWVNGIETILTTAGSNFSPHFANNAILFVSNRNQLIDYWIMNLDGTDQRLLLAFDLIPDNALTIDGSLLLIEGFALILGEI